VREEDKSFCNDEEGSKYTVEDQKPSVIEQVRETA
jgi:hypothetical protein